MKYSIVKSSTGVPESPNKCEVLIHLEDDQDNQPDDLANLPDYLANLPDDLAPGSVAYTASMTLMYMKDIDGTWARIGA